VGSRFASVWIPGVSAEPDLARAAEVGLAFGPTVAFESETIWVDVTGCGHLRGGEAALGGELAAAVRALGHTCRVAIADGPRVAAAVARHARTAPGRTPRDVLVVPEGKSRAAMGRLPLDALPVAGDTRRFLAALGMKSLGDVQKLPRASLGARLGANAEAAMALLDGDDRAPLTPYRPPEIPEERAELEHGVSAHEALLFVTKTLCDRLGPRLLGRAMGAARLVLAFKLDRALVEAGGQAPRASTELALPAPLQRAPDLFAALRPRVEALSLVAPALAVTLSATELVPMESRTRDLFVPEARADLALPRLVAELCADVGADRVGVLELADAWTPDARGPLAPYPSRPAPALPEGRLLTGAPEPLRLLRTPRPLARALPSVELVLRLEAVAWWRRGVSRLDYGTAWMEDDGARAWVEVDGVTGAGVVRGWME